MSAFIARGHKNIHKLSFYSRHAIHRLFPGACLRARRRSILRQIDAMGELERLQVLWRVNYYNKLEDSFSLPSDATRIQEFKREKSWAYYLDFLGLLRYFPVDWHFFYEFGDVREVPDYPSFVKSRPIRGDNKNSVLLKLNKVRHYYFVRDKVPFDAKLDKLVWRGACHQPHRRRFIEAFHDHPLCDVGDVHRKAKGMPWHLETLSVANQLRYKFVLSIEGNDVATNTKWIMASNSLCFMKKPKYETWFMEGALIPGRHYVQLKDDYSDLEEKIFYYSHHPEEAKRITWNANQHVAQFLNNKKELVVSLLTIKKYFEKTGQC